MEILYIGHDTPHGTVSVISPNKFTWEEGKNFLSIDIIQEYLDKLNPTIGKHWFIPPATGKILPIRTKKNTLITKNIHNI